MAKKSFKIIPWRARDFDQDLNKELEELFGNRVQKTQLIAQICSIYNRLGAISKMDISTLQYFTFALKSKANTKMSHHRALNDPLITRKVWGQASFTL